MCSCKRERERSSLSLPCLYVICRTRLDMRSGTIFVKRRTFFFWPRHLWLPGWLDANFSSVVGIFSFLRSNQETFLHAIALACIHQLLFMLKLDQHALGSQASAIPLFLDSKKVAATLMSVDPPDGKVRVQSRLSLILTRFKVVGFDGRKPHTSFTVVLTQGRRRPNDDPVRQAADLVQGRDRARGH